MFEFHADRKTYFRHQKENAQRYVIPFIEAQQALPKLARVLEIGCAEGGVLAAFVAHGCYGVGVELDGQRLAMANDFLSEEVAAEKVKLINKNIYDFDFQQEAGDKFDLIVLKDVIEHI
ncbi:MAG: methyltransferase domain-containing protein, partial [Saprospiraceae bacterium]